MSRAANGDDRMNPFPIVVALFRRNRATVLLFVCLVMLAVALGVAVSAQERALRQGSARAADRFDLIVGAPGSQTELLMNIVYLQPSAVEL
jgi:putative ABC transport system permease protein